MQELPNSPAMDASALRKIKKPIIEKKRRDRINNSLEQLKSILLENVIKTDTPISRLDKADILEMTVKYIKQLQKRGNTSTKAFEDTVPIAKEYESGYKECKRDTISYFNSANRLRHDMKSRVGIHLSNCVSQVSGELSTPKNPRENSAFHTPIAVPGKYSYLSSLNVNIPASIQFQSTTPRRLDNNATLIKPVPIHPLLKTELPYSPYYPPTGRASSICSTPTEYPLSDQSSGYSSCHNQSFQGGDSSMDRDSLGNSVNNNSLNLDHIWRPW
ncbi:hypothetical protein CHS0354_030658 [Potamilus streckersoni]|uniref:BHLH domain-containing protein n=1 Tax=Potamilus streckersoni TaxID=2493646 RepID=A0AAE0RY24_9BIVA|nr:hypothetical protein CHS0354_030658 [Potamilus streckersoni]